MTTPMGETVIGASRVKKRSDLPCTVRKTSRLWHYYALRFYCVGLSLKRTGRIFGGTTPSYGVSISGHCSLQAPLRLHRRLHLAAGFFLVCWYTRHQAWYRHRIIIPPRKKRACHAHRHATRPGNLQTSHHCFAWVF